MKKIELNAPLRFVLIILTWLLTFTVVNLAGALNNGGAGLIGTLVLYVGLLYLEFVYFDDCELKKAAKFALVVMVILIAINLISQCYGYCLTTFQVDQIKHPKLYKAVDSINGMKNIICNLTIAICLIVNLITALNASCDKKECCCKAEAKEVEAPKEEAKEEKAEGKTEE